MCIKPPEKCKEKPPSQDNIRKTIMISSKRIFKSPKVIVKESTNNYNKSKLFI